MIHCTAISDCHCKFPADEDLPGGDFLFDCGDFTFRGREEETLAHIKFLRDQLQKYRYVVFIAGNHELTFEDKPDVVKDWLKDYLSNRFIYLQEESVVIDGFKIYGAPQQPFFGRWAFNVFRGSLHKHWDKIPDDTDILITHGPPRGYGDFVIETEWHYNPLGQENPREVKRHEGCDELLHALKRVQPQVHLFGHFHGASGKYYGSAHDGIEGMTIINASQCDEGYNLSNKPYNFSLKKPRT